MKIKYMNAGQARILNNAIADIWAELSEYGCLHGGGIKQLEDAEIVVVAQYETGSILTSLPENIKGFRILVEERDFLKI